MDEYLKAPILNKSRDDLPVTTRKDVPKPSLSYSRIFCVGLAVSLALGMIYLLRPGSLNARPTPTYPVTCAGSKENLKEPGAPFAPEDIQRLWGYLSPYHSVQEYKPPPPGCTVKQVNILQRHGARFPELDDYKAIKKAIRKYQKADGYSVPELQFLKNYSFDLGAEDLVKYGGKQSWTSGAVAYSRYKALIDDENMPFIRASLSDRVVETGLNWSAGFHIESKQKFQPDISVYIDECSHCNNTLFNNNCPKAKKSHKKRNKWIKIYASSAADRLNSAAIGLKKNITAKDAFRLMMMCPFHTLYHQEYSPFCKIFNKTEFEGFEYALDLEQYFKTGYGQVQDLGRMQGVGYINELLARFTDSPVKDETQTNSTLDGDPKTFPLKKTMYVDFAHDHQMVAIYSAMGLFNATPLDPSKMHKDRRWVVSDIVPFSARMSAERLQCTNPLHGRWNRPWGKKDRDGEYVRILINDAVQPLDFCGGGEDGLCELNDFIKSQHYARTNGEGNFWKCGYKPDDDE